MMEHFLSSLNSVIATWLNSSVAPWVTDTIFGVLCGVGLFLLLIPFLDRKPPSPPHRKHRKIEKCPVEPKRRSKKNNKTLKACRNCLKELEEAQGLVSLLQSHFKRLSNKGGFRQSPRQDLPGNVHKAKPAGARQPCGEPVEDVAPVLFSLASPAPLIEHPPPLSSTLSPSPMTSSVSVSSCSSASASQPPDPFLPMDILLPQPPALSTSLSCFLDSENHSQDWTTDTHSDAFLDADISASHISLFSSMTISSGDMSAPKVLRDFTSGGGRSQKEPPRFQDESKSQSKMFVPTWEKEDSRRLNPGEHREILAEMKNSQAGGISAPLDKKLEESLRRKSFQLMQKEQPPPESFLKNKIKHFLQWMFPRKDKKLKDEPQKGQPASATDQSSEPVKSGPIMGSRVAEAQVLATAVGQILEEKMALCHGLSTSEVNWRKEELQAPVDPHLCYQRALSYKEQRRAMENMADDYQVTPNGHNYPNESRWTRDRDSKWFFPPRELESPERPYQHELKMTRPSDQIHYYAVPCPLQKYVSLGQPERASHAFPGRNFLQEKMYTMQRETFFYHVSTPSVR